MVKRILPRRDTTGTVNTKMLEAGWGMCGIDIKVMPTRACV